MQKDGILTQHQRDARAAIHELMAAHGITLFEIRQAGRVARAAAPGLTREQSIKLAQILTMMEFWRISPAEVAAALGKQAAAVVRGADGTLPTRGAAPAYVKYRHPKTGLTWDGRGEHPLWLRQALLKEGWRVEELLPDNQR